jgi:hypothetical protein
MERFVSVTLYRTARCTAEWILVAKEQTRRRLNDAVTRHWSAAARSMHATMTLAVTSLVRHVAIDKPWATFCASGGTTPLLARIVTCSLAANIASASTICILVQGAMATTHGWIMMEP